MGKPSGLRKKVEYSPRLNGDITNPSATPVNNQVCRGAYARAYHAPANGTAASNRSAKIPLRLLRPNTQLLQVRRANPIATYRDHFNARRRLQRPVRHRSGPPTARD